jgi:hypothetical protein
VRIIECRNTDDFFRNNTATVSNGNYYPLVDLTLLAWNAMARNCVSRKDNLFKCNFQNSKEPDMELFYGQRNEAADMTWTQAGMPLVSETNDAFSFADASEDKIRDRLPDFAFNEKHELRIYKSLQEEKYIITIRK